MPVYLKEDIVLKYKKGIYFYCLPPGPPEWMPYLFKTIAIAEGLKELGIPFYSNINYWKLNPDREEFLFNHHPDFSPDDADLVVLECAYTSFGIPFPDEVFKQNRNYKLAYIDNADGLFTDSMKPISDKFDIIFKAQKNAGFAYPANVVPDVFGLTQRIIDCTTGNQVFENRKRSILVNFRVQHTLRDLFKDQFLPNLEELLEIDNSSNDLSTNPESSYDHLMWTQTGRRHHPAYFQNLKNSAACASIGGNLMQTYPKDYFSSSYYAKLQRKFFHYSGIGGNKRIIQFDNWRFWESLAAGCTTFHADLGKYGAELPVMPENFVHYIGVDFDNVKRSAERIKDQPGILKKIADEGNKWVMKHYSPKATALRFLQETVKKT